MVADDLAMQGAWTSAAMEFTYYQTSNISHTKSQNLNVSFLVLQLSLPQSIEARC